MHTTEGAEHLLWLQEVQVHLEECVWLTDLNSDKLKADKNTFFPGTYISDIRIFFSIKNSNLKVNPDFEAKTKRTDNGLFGCSVQKVGNAQNKNNQTRCHIQIYSNSVWLWIVQLFLLITTVATWIFTWSWESVNTSAQNNKWKVGGAKTSVRSYQFSNLQTSLMFSF